MVSHGLWKIRSPVYHLHDLGLIYGMIHMINCSPLKSTIVVALHVHQYVAVLDELGLADDLDEAYEENVDSHLDEALVLEEVVDLGMFYNSINDDSSDEPNEVELEVEMR
ncbi:hypothetical protein Tco_0093117 [Tanacetum coccineum]